MMALRKTVILRRPRSGRLAGRTMLFPGTPRVLQSSRRCGRGNRSAPRHLLEMLRQGQALALVGRAAGCPVELVGPGDQALVHEPADDLAVLDHERDLVRAHFEDGPATGPARLGHTEAGIKEARVMHPKFSDE